MTRTTVRKGNNRCPSCGEEKKRLSRHWAYCEWPEFDDLHEILIGAILGGGSLNGTGQTKHYRVGTTHRQLAEWLTNRFGWLAHSLSKVTYDGERSTQFIARTHAHQTLTAYRSRWYQTGEKTLRSDIDLAPQSARVWYALAGSIEWTGPYNSQHRISFSSEADERADTIQTLLESINIDSTRRNRRVSTHQVSEFLEYVGDPIPGVEYKWSDNIVEYRTLRDEPQTQIEYRVQMAKHALQIARERTDKRLTPGVFDNRIDIISAADVAETLGGGSFGDAATVAGVSTAETNEETDYDYSPSSNTQWSREEILNAMSTAAESIDAPLTHERYNEWADNREVPSLSTIGYRIGWKKAAEVVGAEISPWAGIDVSSYPQSDIIDSIERAAKQMGEPLRWADYLEWYKTTNCEAPHPSTISQNTGWENALQLAGVETGSKDT